MGKLDVDNSEHSDVSASSQDRSPSLSSKVVALGLAAVGTAYSPDAKALECGDVDTVITGTAYNTRGTTNNTFAGLLGDYGVISESGATVLKETQNGVDFDDITALAKAAHPEFADASSIALTGYAPSFDRAIAVVDSSCFLVDDFTSGYASWSLTPTTNDCTGVSSVDDFTGDTYLSAYDGRTIVLNDTTGTPLLSAGEGDPVVDGENGELAVFSSSRVASLRDFSGANLGDLSSSISIPTNFVPAAFVTPEIGEGLYIYSTQSGRLEYCQNGHIPSEDGGTDTGAEDTAVDTGVPPEEETGAETGDTAETETAETDDTAEDSGDTADSADTVETGDTSGTGPDCTDVLPEGSGVTSQNVDVAESAVICTPDGATAVEMSGPADIVASDTDGDGTNDEILVTVGEGAVFNVQVGGSGDYTVTIQYPTNTALTDDDGNPYLVEGGTELSLDAGDRIDGAAGVDVDAFTRVNANLNACNEKGVQGGPIDTMDSTQWLNVDVASGKAVVRGMHDLPPTTVVQGEFGSFADTLLCDPSIEDTTTDTGEDTGTDETGDTNVPGDTGSWDTASETGLDSGPSCGCSTPLTGRDGATTALAIGALALSAARRKK